MINIDETRYKVMMWGSMLGLLIYAASAFYLHYTRTELSDEIHDESMAACEQAESPEACRQNVEDLHDDCYRWSLTRHDERPEIDRDKYRGCLKHPPGKFKKTSN